MRPAKTITRRDFLCGATCGAAGIALGLPSAAAALGQGAGTRVVLVRHPEAMDGDGHYDGEVMTKMLDDAVMALAGIDEPVASWQTLLSADDILGIKSNTWPYLPTPRVLEEAIEARGAEVGIPEKNISVGDQGILDDPVFRRATALVNVRPLRTHHWAGIGGCLKNYIMFVREPWEWHDDSCADLGGLWNLPVCKDKTRLNILVVMKPLFYGIGAHHFDPEHVWHYKGLLVSTDPVAVDAIGVKLLAEMRLRHFERPPRGGTSTKHVQLADTRHGVGVADPTKIDLMRVGWMEDALI